MPNYRRDFSGRTYFFTLVSNQRRALLCESAIRLGLRDAITELRRGKPFEIDAWVLLPDHLHCIWTLPTGDHDYPARWGWLKKRLTQRARHEGLIDASGVSLWQSRYWEHRIRDPRDFLAHCHYIHWNPVKHGLVSRVRDWPWSTFHRFVRIGRLPVDWGGAGIDLPADVGHE